MSKVKADFLLASNAPLENLAAKEEVEGTVDQSLSDIFPIKHTIDLIQENIYALENQSSESLIFYYLCYIN